MIKPQEPISNEGDDAEAAQRRDDALRRALTTPPKPHKPKPEKARPQKQNPK